MADCRHSPSTASQERRGTHQLGRGGRYQPGSRERGQRYGRIRSRGARGGTRGQSRSTIKSGPSPDESGQSSSAAAADEEKAGKTAVRAVGDIDSGDTCFICASKVEYTSVTPCNHRTCHICALRLRALYKSKACAHCRTEASFVIFTDDPAKSFEDFRDADLPRSDGNLGIKYEKDGIFEDTVLLLRYNCPDDECDVACLGWPDLHRHVKNKHGKIMCDHCTRNKKVFTHEHELFSAAGLRRHEKYGDDVPGAVDQSGFKGHPECGFCRQRFYGDDELYAHCRDRHERCHICDRRSGSWQQQYYIDYAALEDHFQKYHFLCLDKECLDTKFVVFDSELDLKAHQLECHPNGLSKDARRDARTVDLSYFDYRTPYQDQRQRRGAGRGRDPNADPLPVSSAQPLRRDEIAYQRQMAIQSAQSISTRNFGGQLTRDDARPEQAPDRSASVAPARTLPSCDPPTQEMEDISLGSDPGPVTPQIQARRLRHASVIERASNLLHNDPNKLSEFRTKVSHYRSSTISATGLIDSFFALFDTSSLELGKLIKELAEIYEDESKRKSLLEAWNDWRAINEDYPALSAPSGTLSSDTSSTGLGGRRVLRLKSSTAQSSRSAFSRSGTLPGSASSVSFPPLSSATNSSSKRPIATTSWGVPAPHSSIPSVSFSHSSSRKAQTTATATATARARATAATTANSDAFPALPSAPKPSVLMAGLTRGTVRWEERRTQSAWGPSPGLSSGDVSDAELDPPGDGSGNRRGKGKKGKQTIFRFG